VGGQATSAGLVCDPNCDSQRIEEDVGVEFEDYYSVLGVDRDASQKEIQKAYKKKAREHHPDVSDDPDAEEKFKQLNEAYEVLKDPEKRQRYDQMGQNYRPGQEVDPPPGWENMHVNFGGGRGQNPFGGGGGFGGGRGAEGMGGFSDFFEAFFGDMGAQARGGRPGAGPGGAQFRGGGRSRGRTQKGQSHKARLTVSLEDVYHQRERQISLPVERVQPNGQRVRENKTYKVKIPPGTTNGSKIRLAGEGESSAAGGQAGDILLEISIAEHPVFEVDEYDLRTEVALTPWEAALGAKVDVPTVDGEATVNVPAGSQSGRKLRLKDKGLADNEGGRGDLYVAISIKVPEELTDDERELFEKMQDASSFDPREHRN
jgi:curved DNA-binding protein